MISTQNTVKEKFMFFKILVLRKASHKSLIERYELKEKSIPIEPSNYRVTPIVLTLTCKKEAWPIYFSIFSINASLHIIMPHNFS